MMSGGACPASGPNPETAAAAISESGTALVSFGRYYFR